MEFPDDSELALGTKHLILVNMWSANPVDEAIEASNKNNVFSFMITRNPYERILSAYRSFYETLSNDKSIKKFLEEKKKDKLTFKHFIEYLVNLPLQSFDFHWMPMYLMCKPCQLKYDVVGRMDSLREDSKKILSRLSLNLTLGHDHPTVGGSSGSDENLVEYYSEIGPDLMEKLYLIYEMDFILFDYEKFYTIRRAL